MAIYSLIIGVIVFVAFLSGIIILQIYLSKGNNKWLGLILPAMFFLISIVGIVSMISYQSNQVQAVTENGKVIEKVTSSIDVGSIIVTIMVGYPLLNIPTGVLLLIYAVCRDKKKKLSNLDKMRVQDLE
jgi:hypothetical protein